MTAARGDPLPANEGGTGPSFSVGNRFARSVFTLVWALGASWTPPPFHVWRVALLRLFGARIGQGVRLYGTTKIWLPSNLEIEDGALIGPRVRLYNQGRVFIGKGAVLSQGSHVCASSHAVHDPNFQLILRPVRISTHAWVAADAFVGPGVTVGEGAVLGARSVAFTDLAAWTIYRGNPAEMIGRRSWQKHEQ